MKEKMLIVVVIRLGCSLCHDLSLWVWRKRYLPWQTHYFELLTKKNVGHCCGPSLSVMGSGHWPHNISDEKSFPLLYLDLSQILMIWYGLQPSILFIYEDVYLVCFLSLQSKTALIVLYMNYPKLHSFFYKNLIFH